MILLNTLQTQTRPVFEPQTAISDKGKGFVQKLNMPQQQTGITEEADIDFLLSALESLENNIQLNNNSLPKTIPGTIGRLDDALKEVGLLKNSGEKLSSNFSDFNLSTSAMLDLFSGSEIEETV